MLLLRTILVSDLLLIARTHVQSPLPKANEAHKSELFVEASLKQRREDGAENVLYRSLCSPALPQTQAPLFHFSAMASVY